jgi:DNA-binding protein HU-beta
MNKKELSQELAARRDLTDKAAAELVDAVLDLITEKLSEGDKVALSGFGTFEVRDRSARTGRNPQTGEAMEIDARKAPAFRAGKKLKEVVQ